MNRTISIALIALSALSTMFLAAQTQPGTSTACLTVVGESNHSFGTIEGDATVSHTFVFKNNCKETIEIDAVKPSCGCTAAVLNEKMVKPGAEAKIEVKFTPTKGSRGKVNKSVSVFVAGQTEAHTILHFTAEIRTDLDIQPPYVQLFDAEVGKEMTASVTFRNTSAATIEIKELSFAATAYVDTGKVRGRNMASYPLKTHKLSATSFSLRAGDSKVVGITFTPEYDGQFLGTLRIKTDKAEENIQVTGHVYDKRGTTEKEK